MLFELLLSSDSIKVTRAVLGFLQFVQKGILDPFINNDINLIETIADHLGCSLLDTFISKDIILSIISQFFKVLISRFPDFPISQEAQDHIIDFFFECNVDSEFTSNLLDYFNVQFRNPTQQGEELRSIDFFHRLRNRILAISQWKPTDEMITPPNPPPNDDIPQSFPENPIEPPFQLDIDPEEDDDPDDFHSPEIQNEHPMQEQDNRPQQKTPLPIPNPAIYFRMMTLYCDNLDFEPPIRSMLSECFSIWQMTPTMLPAVMEFFQAVVQHEIYRDFFFTETTVTKLMKLPFQISLDLLSTLSQAPDDQFQIYLAAGLLDFEVPPGQHNNDSMLALIQNIAASDDDQTIMALLHSPLLQSFLSEIEQASFSIQTGIEVAMCYALMHMSPEVIEAVLNVWPPLFEYISDLNPDDDLKRAILGLSYVLDYAIKTTNSNLMQEFLSPAIVEAVQTTIENSEQDGIYYTAAMEIRNFIGGNQPES